MEIDKDRSYLSDKCLHKGNMGPVDGTIDANTKLLPVDLSANDQKCRSIHVNTSIKREKELACNTNDKVADSDEDDEALEAADNREDLTDPVAGDNYLDDEEDEETVEAAQTCDDKREEQDADPEEDAEPEEDTDSDGESTDSAKEESNAEEEDAESDQESDEDDDDWPDDERCRYCCPMKDQFLRPGPRHCYGYTIEAREKQPPFPFLALPSPVQWRIFELWHETWDASFMEFQKLTQPEPSTDGGMTKRCNYSIRQLPDNIFRTVCKMFSALGAIHQRTAFSGTAYIDNIQITQLTPEFLWIWSRVRTISLSITKINNEQTISLQALPNLKKVELLAEELDEDPIRRAETGSKVPILAMKEELSPYHMNKITVIAPTWTRQNIGRFADFVMEINTAYWEEELDTCSRGRYLYKEAALNLSRYRIISNKDEELVSIATEMVSDEWIGPWKHKDWWCWWQDTWEWEGMNDTESE